jgi:hypothetical protein
MGKRRNLNGLPNSLVESYLSTLMYFDNGYMACWIWKRASELEITEIEIDIINGTTKPPKFKSKPIVAYLGQLRGIISKTLLSNGFDPSFIDSAKFKVWITKQDAVLRQVSCQGIVEDIDGRIYEGKVYKETAYPIAD